MEISWDNPILHSVNVFRARTDSIRREAESKKFDGRLEEFALREICVQIVIALDRHNFTHVVSILFSILRKNHDVVKIEA